MTMQVEFLVCFGFGGPGVGMWDTFTYDVPESECDDGADKLVEWFCENHLDELKVQFDVAHVGIYYIGESNEDEDT